MPVGLQARVGNCNISFTLAAELPVTSCFLFMPQDEAKSAKKASLEKLREGNGAVALRAALVKVGFSIRVGMQTGCSVLQAFLSEADTRFHNDKLSHGGHAHTVSAAIGGGCHSWARRRVCVRVPGLDLLPGCHGSSIPWQQPAACGSGSAGDEWESVGGSAMCRAMHVVLKIRCPSAELVHKGRTLQTVRDYIFMVPTVL
jgi:hypothetical protein